MASYLLRRLAMAVLVVFGISLITFAIIYFLPADPARMYAGPNASVAAVERIRHQLGLDQPLWVQYGRYLERVFVHGDFGYSYKLQMPVTAAILSRLPNTLELIFAAIFVELAVGLPTGVYAAVRKGRWADSLSIVLALLGVSAPPFWLGLLLLYLFGYLLGWLPLGGAGGPQYLILPALTAGLGGAGWYARMARSSVLEVLGRDYVRTARAKGLGEARVILGHVLRNALNPIITMAGQDVPWFVGNIAVVEMVFAWPGIGRLAVNAILLDDVPLVMGTVTFAALLVVVANVLVDLAQALVDPQIRFD
ncbi:MAG: ABC transporter permease [Firmicutes bacterium]|nr:ABC transporter permease [Bacillota bacterium]